MGWWHDLPEVAASWISSCATDGPEPGGASSSAGACSVARVTAVGSAAAANAAVSTDPAVGAEQAHESGQRDNPHRLKGQKVTSISRSFCASF